MKIIKLAIAIVSFVLINGCATIPPQEPIAFSPSEERILNKISVSMADVPETTMGYPGAGCLLCVGIAAAAHSDLSAHVKTLDNSELINLSTEVTELLEENGYDVELLSEPVNINKLKKYEFVENSDARKDHRALLESLGTSHLLVLNIDYSGMQRDYNGYFPTSDPYSLVLGYAYLVNLNDNKYEWYLPLYEKNSVGEEWKEAPDYPGLTNAFYKGTATVRDSVLTALAVKDEE